MYDRNEWQWFVRGNSRVRKLYGVSKGMDMRKCSTVVCGFVKNGE